MRTQTVQSGNNKKANQGKGPRTHAAAGLRPPGPARRQGRPRARDRRRSRLKRPSEGVQGCPAPQKRPPSSARHPGTARPNLTRFGPRPAGTEGGVASRPASPDDRASVRDSCPFRHVPLHRSHPGDRPTHAEDTQGRPSQRTSRTPSCWNVDRHGDARRADVGTRTRHTGVFIHSRGFAHSNGVARGR